VLFRSNKEKSARIESSGSPEPMDKITPTLWQQELHYFIVEKILSIGICRMDVIFKAIDDGVLHVPQSYTKGNHKKNFIKTHILSLLDDSLDRKFIDFVVPVVVVVVVVVGVVAGVVVVVLIVALRPPWVEEVIVIPFEASKLRLTLVIN